MIYFRRRHDHRVDCYLYHALVPPYRLYRVRPCHLSLVPYQVALWVGCAPDLVDLKENYNIIYCILYYIKQRSIIITIAIDVL